MYYAGFAGPGPSEKARRDSKCDPEWKCSGMSASTKGLLLLGVIIICSLILKLQMVDFAPSYYVATSKHTQMEQSVSTNTSVN
jgi:hypothetical protein